MSFIGAVEKGVVYAPGYFLAHEECERKTKTISASSALAVTAADGSKYVPMGTAYPTNDGSAVGILYEDVDVTTGSMPGSVVMGGVIYEDRLAATGFSYSSATVTSADNPTTKGWYEKEGDTYTASNDTVVDRDKKYYTQSGSDPSYTYTQVETIVYGDNPKALGLYEKSGDDYILSTDTQADGSKTYYEASVERLASAAKTALQALGFKFVSEASGVTRPY